MREVGIIADAVHFRQVQHLQSNVFEARQQIEAKQIAKAKSAQSDPIFLSHPKGYLVGSRFDIQPIFTTPAI